ncbi:MAG TPA: methionine--tRNA ligase subunit beta [Candidatus Saccharimonadales bacterium]|nr:methionine--tRNA ligase subunit beta [Candidatus Saccharimonadales bacterium]
MISIDDFKKVEIRIGKVVSCEKVEDTDKLLKLTFDFGDEKRIIVSGIAESYSPEDVVGMEIPVIVNLEPRTIRGVESQGMILAAISDDKPIVLTPQKEVAAGSRVG